MSDEMKVGPLVAREGAISWLTDDQSNIEKAKQAKTDALGRKLLETLTQEHWVEDRRPTSYHRMTKVDPQKIREIEVGLEETQILISQVPLATLSSVDAIVVVASSPLKEFLAPAFAGLVPDKPPPQIFSMISAEDLPPVERGTNVLFTGFYRETGVSLFVLGDQMRNAGGRLVAAAVFLDCSPWIYLPPKMYSVVSRPIERYQERDCPFCRQRQILRKR